MAGLKKIQHLIIAGAFLFGGCTSKQDEPADVLNHFLDAMYKKDFKTARQLSTEDSKLFLDGIEMQSRFIHTVSFPDPDYYNREKMIFGNTSVTNDTLAKIPVTVQIKDGTIKPVYTLKKHGTEWKVDMGFSSQIEFSSPVNAAEPKQSTN
jgi:hypothetical protein